MERDGKMEWKGREGERRGLEQFMATLVRRAFKRGKFSSPFFSRNEHLHETDILGNAGIARNGENEGMLKL